MRWHYVDKKILAELVERWNANGIQNHIGSFNLWAANHLLK